MGRAGSGGGSRGGGGSRSSGGSGGSRSRSSGSRAGSGSSFRSSSSSYSRHSSYGGGHRSYHNTIYYGTGSSLSYGAPFRVSSGPTPFTFIWVILAAIFICGFILAENSGPKSTVVRTKIESGYSFDYNCVEDELAWFDSATQTGKKLRYFHDKTGVQPYIYLKAYDPNIVTSDDKEAFANQYYKELFGDRQDVFLYVYFAEADQDNDVGDEAWWIGAQAGSVMDSEAVDIFFHRLDALWYGDSSTDDMFVKTFEHTADKVMKVDRGPWVTISIVVSVAGMICIFMFVYKMTVEKNRRAKEEAEETERILKTDIDDLAKASGDEDLVDKYL